MHYRSGIVLLGVLVSVVTGAVQKFRDSILLNRDWYLDQMERNGFGRRGFNYETEGDGVTPRINIVAAPYTDNYYRADPWSRVSTAAQNAGYPVWSSGTLRIG